MSKPWDGLFSEQDFAFRFAAKAGDPRRFFSRTDEHDERLALRREILDSASDKHAFQLPAAEAAVSLSE